jgi:hypothetical protein
MIRHDVQYVNASWTSKKVCHTNFLRSKALSLFDLHLKTKKKVEIDCAVFHLFDTCCTSCLTIKILFSKRTTKKLCSLLSLFYFLVVLFENNILMVRHDVQYVNASWTSKTVCHTNFLLSIYIYLCLIYI